MGVLALWVLAQVYVNGALQEYTQGRWHDHGITGVALSVAYVIEIALLIWALLTINARQKQEEARQEVGNAGPRAPGPNDGVETTCIPEEG